MTSRIKVDEIYSKTAGVGVSFPQGFTVAAGFGVTFSGNVNVDGTVTLTSGNFAGSAAGMTDLPTATPSRTYAYANFL